MTQKTISQNLETPFFIVGSPRSGTTLLQILIDAHPNIIIPPESHIFGRFSDIFDYYGDLKKDSNLYLFVKDILQDLSIKEWGLEISVIDFCSQLKITSVKGVISLLFELSAKKVGKNRWGDKTPQNTFYLKEIHKLFPEAKFIHLIRDGRDVTESLKRVFIGPKSIYGIAHRWRKYILTFDEFKKTINSDQFLEIHYEDLVLDLENQVKKIFDFLEEDAETVNSSNIPETERRMFYYKSDPLFDSLNKPISNQKIGIFRKKLTKREIEIFESIAGDGLKIYGYQLETSGKTEIGIHEKIIFFYEDNIFRYLRKLFVPLLRKQINYEVQLKIRKISMLIRNKIRT
ncbi:MAG: sulfotransferase [Okeania sp. SIO2C9]|uniref:sulfotransferase family protein n=1 Tax=Okeania sp. SIO2C9 TaxID=2607791 RepID=UPI0013C254AF|nr:sulfotransferase [Okeania sp. SIO2C9]NEQ76185.1 sulfotransferase [Okeania sp. SIO2C9]